MKIRKQINQQVHNLLMSSKGGLQLYIYGRDGIYFNYGPMKGLNLSKYYNENSDKVEEYLDNIIDNDNTSYKMKMVTKEVIKDLKNNYPNYEVC